MLSPELESLAKLAPIVQTVAFIVSVIFVWIQIRESNRLTRLANNRTSFQLASPYLLQMFQDRKLAELRLNGAKNYEALDEVDQFRYIELLFWWLILHDDIYYQYQNGLMDDKMYQGWDHELQEFIRENDLGVHWKKIIKPFFRPEFRQMIEEKLVAVE